MTVLESIFQGIIQGLSEFLPISSSGHLALTEHLFNFSDENYLFFTVMLHLGTLVAVFIAFFDTIKEMIVQAFKMMGDIFTRKFSYKKTNEQQKAVIMVLITLVPLFIFVFFSDIIEVVSTDNDIIVEGLCFLFTGIMLLVACQNSSGTKTAKDMKPLDAVVIGLVQMVATLPGISRSGSTTSVGMLRGLSKEFAVKFSFIMGIPAILGAGLLELLDALEEGITIEPTVLAAGFLASLIFGLLAIKMVQWLVKTDRYILFAYYTLTVGSLTVTVGIVEHIMGKNIVEIVAGFVR